MRWCLTMIHLIGVGFLTGQSYFFRPLPAFTNADIQQISILFQAADQMVWVGTDLGVYAFDGRKYTLISRPDGLLLKVTAIGENPNGQILIGYEDGYLHACTLYGLNQEIKTDSLAGTAISKILFRGKDEIIITTYGNGIWRSNAGRWEKVRHTSLDPIEDIYDALIDRNGMIWMATDNGVWMFDPNHPESISHLGREQGLPDEIVTQLVLAHNGDVWIGLYDHGVARYMQDQDTVIALMSGESLFGNVIKLVNGRTQDVWIGTDKMIGYYTNHGKGHSIPLPAESKDRLESLLLDQTGNLWIASGNNLFIANTQLEYFIPGVSGIQAIATSKEKLWLGCNHGLYSLDRHTQQIQSHLENEQINILSIYADPIGNLWIGTFGQGLYIYNPDLKRSRHLTEKDHISNNSILNIDGLGQSAWLATLGGITQINWKSNPLSDQLNIVEFQDQFNFPEGYVYDVYAADDGKIWFGTDGIGLYYLEQNELKPFQIHFNSTANHENEIKTIYSVASDENQSIWISGTKGQIVHVDAAGQRLSQFVTAQGTPTSLIASGNGHMLLISEGMIRVINRKGDLFYFHETSGLKTFTPNINATARDLDGTIWIADAEKILHYLPFQNDIQSNVEIHLEALEPGTVWTADAITLQPDNNFLDIRFTGLWYQDPSMVRYRYKLEGHDKDWIYTQEGRAVYSKLSPGSYTFVVSGSHHDDFSGASAIHKQIIVLPPIYLRWWFVLGMTLVIAGGIYLYTKGRIKRINKLHLLEKEKTMLRLHAIQAQVNPHFLFNSFNTLASIIEEDQHAAVDYVDQLSAFFRGVLMHRNAERIRMEEEIEIIRNYSYILQKRYGENLRIREHITHTAGWIAPLSIQMLVENAIKHNVVSAEKPLLVDISIDEFWVTVSNPIQPKFQSSAESTGFGLSSLTTRYQYLTNQKIEIYNDLNTFTVKIPVLPSDQPI